MEANEVQADPLPAQGSPAAAKAVAPRPGVVCTMWHGAKAGFRYTSYVVGTVAFPFALAGLAPTFFGLASGRGFGVHPLLIRASGIYLGCAFAGGAIGLVIGLIVALLRGGRLGRRATTLWEAANRPVGASRSESRVPRPTVAATWHSGPPPTPRRRFGRWLFYYVPLSLLLLTQAAAALIGAYFGRAVDRRLPVALAAADHDDPYWRLDDLMEHREPVPDSENSAFVVEQALARLPEKWPLNGGPAPEDEWREGRPAPEDREPYNRGWRAFTKSGGPANFRVDEVLAVAMREELEAQDDAVRHARTLADYRRGRHEIHVSMSVYDTPLPETQVTRNAARLMALDARVRAHDGDIDGALDSCRAILGAGRSIGDEPFGISQFVRMAIGSVAIESIQRVIAVGEPSDEALARLQALVLDEMAEPILLQGVRGERASLDELIRRIRDSEIPIDALTGGYKPQPGDHIPSIAPWGKLMFDNQRAVGLELMNQAVAISCRPLSERPALWRTWNAEVDGILKTPLVSYTATLPILMTPAVSNMGSAHSGYVCKLGATALMLAAERHRRKTGEWPTTIAAIDREILPNPPVDPFTGRPFRIELRDGRIVFYSVGPNGIDEHGAFDDKRYRNGGPDDYHAEAWDVALRRRTREADGKELRGSTSTP